jgi:DNA helicase-2/ATP-dependent DNA helicase PcrA
MMTKKPKDFLHGLNPAQQSAATHVEGPLLVVAGPGSGKTRVVVHRIAHMIASGVSPESIVALTFTNKAADEMRQRVTQLVGPQPVEMGTFHRFSARLPCSSGPQSGRVCRFPGLRSAAWQV